MSLLAKKGWWMTQAPLGLKLKHIKTGDRTNDGKVKYRNTLEIDERDNIGEKIQFLLNRFSEGDLNISQLVRIAHKMGVIAKNGKPIVLQTMDRILKHPAYAGYSDSEALLGGELTKLFEFDGIITLDTFNKNQRILKSGKRDQTTPNMIQRISGIFERNALISKEI